MGEYSTVSLPAELKERVEELIEDTGFNNVSEFTKFVLRDIVSQGSFDSPEEYGETADRVRERLKNLGYIE